MKRLLLVTTSYPERDEGAAAAGFFVQDFAKAVHAEGVEVEVVAPARKAGFDVEDGVGVRRFAVPRLPLSLLTVSRPGQWTAIFRTLSGGFAEVQQACLERRPDHILALWALPSGAWARRAGRKFNVPYSTWALGSDIWSLGRIPIIRGMLRGVLREAKHRFADGYGLGKDVEIISGLPCDFLPSSRRFPCRKRTAWAHGRPCKLAFLGRWHPNKGADLLLEALEMLSEQGWAKIAGLRIHGGGPLEDVVVAKGARLVEQGRPVQVGGYLGRTGAAALFEWADYVLLPSRMESIPVVFSDAMAARCPVIATPVGDLPRLLREHHVGLLAESVTPQAFATAMERALGHHLGEQFRDGIEDMARLFDVRKTAGRFVSYLSKPASGK
jgi:glycosyltransferase involved in cell wall biosynthesis